jgi:adenosylhomocysteine nucleosidase
MAPINKREESTVGIIMATRAEAAPLIEALDLKEVKKDHMVLYEGKGIVLVVSGIGKTNAAIATTYCCAVLGSRSILNLGAAGATKTSIPMGEVLHATKVIEYDRPLLFREGLRFYHPQVLPGFKEATLATQDRPVIAPDHRAALAPFADLVDMEGAAIVQVSRRFKTRCFLFKFVSDTPDHPGDTDILECIGLHGPAFCRFIADSVMPAL